MPTSFSPCLFLVVSLDRPYSSTRFLWACCEIIQNQQNTTVDTCETGGSVLCDMFNLSALPLELRIYIWSQSAEPRTIKLQFTRSRGFSKHLDTTGREVSHVFCSAATPAILQVSREARQIMEQYYSRAFAYGYEPRYVWVNWNMDIISVGEEMLTVVQLPDRLLIRRLMLVRHLQDMLFGGDRKTLLEFKNAIEIFVQCMDSTIEWGHADTLINWPCEREHVWLKDSQTGETVNFVDNKRRLDQLIDGQRQLHWRATRQSDFTRNARELLALPARIFVACIPFIAIAISIACYFQT